eukprot:756824-Hanusia_phi.AAC.1
MATSIEAQALVLEASGVRPEADAARRVRSVHVQPRDLPHGEAGGYIQIAHKQHLVAVLLHHEELAAQVAGQVEELRAAVIVQRYVQKVTALPGPLVVRHRGIAGVDCGSSPCCHSM